MSNGDTTGPHRFITVHDLQQVEHECDDRHTRYGVHFNTIRARLNRIEGRQHMLFGDPDTQTPGMLGSMQSDLTSMKADLKSITWKLAVLIGVVTTVVQLAFRFT